ncbi:MAG: hypothetical protein KGR69_05370 [Verrucomicrobia bacterium]|nr:hypothetical protein [Verrucomicrobiota bacterium]
MARQAKSGGRLNGKLSILQAKRGLFVHAVTRTSNEPHRTRSIMERCGAEQHWTPLLNRPLRHRPAGEARQLLSG